MPPAPPPALPTVPELLARMDGGWAQFHDRVKATPGELLEARIPEGTWTRKQMLAHIATWHELTVDRLVRFAESGEPPGLDEHEDAINARAARAAEGRSMGEVVLAMEESFRRLRREVARLTQDQIAANDWWAVAIVRGNTFGHYEEHLPDLDTSR